MKRTVLFLLINFLIIPTNSLFARPTSLPSLWSSVLTENKQKNANTVFHGLKFSIDPNIVTCTAHAKGQELDCRLTIDATTLATVQFVKINVDGKVLDLLRFNRSRELKKRHPSNNSVIETSYQAGVFQTRLQQYTYYELDNIFRPVLIRAFDLVVDNKNIITVTSTSYSDAARWPMIEKELINIERSLSRKSNKK